MTKLVSLAFLVITFLGVFAQATDMSIETCRTIVRDRAGKFSISREHKANYIKLDNLLAAILDAGSDQSALSELTGKLNLSLSSDKKLENHEVASKIILLQNETGLICSTNVTQYHTILDRIERQPRDGRWQVPLIQAQVNGNYIKLSQICATKSDYSNIACGAILVPSFDTLADSIKKLDSSQQ